MGGKWRYEVTRATGEYAGRIRPGTVLILNWHRDAAVVPVQDKATGVTLGELHLRLLGSVTSEATS